METHDQYHDPRDGDDCFLKPPGPALTPEEDFDAFFESWQGAEEDAHMQQVLAALEAQGRAHDISARMAP